MHGITEALARPLPLKRCTLPHRMVRSATYEGMADAVGVPQPALRELYLDMVREAPCTIITGFCAVSRQGRAMHPGQAGIWDDVHIRPWKEIVDAVHAASPDTRLFMQLAHSGRQTLAEATGLPVKGASGRRCGYFRQKVAALSEKEAHSAVADFAAAALRARRAGFDGVQIHAAHGYLIHQFLSPHTNARTDPFKDRGLFLQLVVEAVREACGPDFPLLLKISCGDDRGLVPQHVIPALHRVEAALDAVEVSYGTMEYALNIIRGACPIDAILRVNPLFNRIPAVLRALWKCCVFPYKRGQFMPFTPCYNLAGACEVRDALSVPVFPVGGIHSLEAMRVCMEDNGFSAVALCRPFISEPNLAARVLQGQWKHSRCSVCNLCTVHCDSAVPLRCYQHYAGRGAQIALHGGHHEI